MAKDTIALHTPRLEDGLYLMGETTVKLNAWIDTPPYATMQSVFTQDFDGNVAFEWVESQLTQDTDGNYKIIGIGNSKPLKYYMIVPMPFDNPDGWHWAMDEEAPIRPRTGKQYVIAVEERMGMHTGYKLCIAYYKPGKYSDWAGFESAELANSRTVIAWREFPRPKAECKE